MLKKNPSQKELEGREKWINRGRKNNDLPSSSHSIPSPGTTENKNCDNPAKGCAGPAWGESRAEGKRKKKTKKQCSEEGTILSRFTRSNPESFYSNAAIIFSISHISTVATQHGAGVEGGFHPPQGSFLSSSPSPGGKTTLTTAPVLVHKPRNEQGKKSLYFPSFVDVPPAQSDKGPH